MRLLLLLFLLGIAADVCDGQPVPDSIRFERVGHEQGLTHNTILSVLQDRNGYLWFGTLEGLNRFDGYHFSAYRHNPLDTVSLPNNTIRALAEDARGRIWVGTSNGVARMDRSRDQLVRYNLPAAQSSNSQDVGGIVARADGGILAYTLDGRLFRYDPGKDVFKAWQPSAIAEGRRYFQPFQEGGGAVWIPEGDNSSTRWLRVDPASKAVSVVASASHRRSPTANPPKIHIGNSGAVWIERAAADRFDRLPPSAQFLPKMHRSLHARAVHEDRHGNLWIGTAHGLYMGEVGGSLRRRVIENRSAGALSEYVWAIYEDRAGSVWIGTGSGLFRYDPFSNASVHMQRLMPHEHVLHAVMAVQQGADGTLWIGMLGDGLLRYHPQTKDTRHIRQRTGDGDTAPEDRIWALKEDDRGRIWIGSDAGLSYLDPLTGKITALALPRARNGSVPAVYGISRSSDGSLWIAGDEDLHRLDASTLSIERHAGVYDSVDLATLQTVYVDTQDRVWIGTEGAGLLLLDSETQKPIAYPYGGLLPRALPGRTVWAIQEGDDGRLWLGTDLGLVSLDPSTGHFVPYYEPEVRGGSSVYSIVAVDGERLWLGTTRGIVTFDIKNELHHRRLTGEPEMVEYNRRSATAGLDGRLYFGGMTGLTSFHPDALRRNTYEPPVDITLVTAYDNASRRAIRPDTLSGETLRLSYSENTLEFEFVALNFADPHRNKYAYKLEGVDQDWVQAGDQRRARYTNLGPGGYNFRVRGSNNDGIWNETGAALRMYIAPPFWGTWWFRIAVVAAVVGIIAAAYRYRISTLLEMQRMRLRIAGDLHDDVGSRLAGIALASELVRDRGNKADEERRELTSISESARQLIEALRDIVWFVDPDHEKPGELAAKMNSAARQMLNGTSLSFRADIGPAIDEAGIDFRRNLFLIYKEAIHNVARHASAEHVDVVLTDANGVLTLRIQDDGCGFDASMMTDGHGLRSMARRAEQLGASLRLESSKETGTLIEIATKIT